MVLLRPARGLSPSSPTQPPLQRSVPRTSLTRGQAGSVSHADAHSTERKHRRGARTGSAALRQLPRAPGGEELGGSGLSRPKTPADTASVTRALETTVPCPRPKGTKAAGRKPGRGLCEDGVCSETTCDLPCAPSAGRARTRAGVLSTQDKVTLPATRCDAAACRGREH